ncbi:5-oxoprolinase subunit PxpB [Cohnella pontilimi]|uniref:5-oxoprolinase subunit PxpB n=1 Tax=Cohnella pontilimi TaxID=2564100 RepID=A0A4U0F8J1_9BACL|nr:5-oxoprolinase subunit PxpB [Cohnella pontilimi]TJY40997.1 5-oxoprolinase subunit PxpB [Cohnella pontilimi]
MAVMDPLGDSALLLAWPETGETGHREIAAMAAHIHGLSLPWVKELVPAFRTLAIHLDTRKVKQEGGSGGMAEGFRLVEARLRQEIENAGDHAKVRVPRHIRLPVVFGGEEGPDLAACAQRGGVSPDEFVRAYCSSKYDVAMIGFAPGFPYLAGLPERLVQPRHPAPRLKVPAGSVGIAGNQTGVYSVESPGGWQLIGRTFTPLFRPEREEPFLLAPGDRVSFFPADGERESVSQDALGGIEYADAEKSVCLELLKSGLLTTLQDLGRPGWRMYGVSAGGAMDRISVRTANWLVGNDERAAVLEMTMIGAVMKVRRDTLAAICGADLEAHVDGEPVPMDRPVWLRAGSTISFGRSHRGCRCYLAVSGGFEAPVVLGSRSTDARAGIGGLNGRALAAGDRLAAGSPSADAARLAHALEHAARVQSQSWASVSWSAETFATASDFGEVTLRIIPGAEWEEFDPETRDELLAQTYRVDASSDRMGLRLSGPALVRVRDGELSSHGVVPGTVQVPPNGQPIVLAAGCQPTGGYPKIAHIIGADLPLLAQCRPGDDLRFRLVDLQEAWRIKDRLARHFSVLQAGIALALKKQIGADEA